MNEQEILTQIEKLNYACIYITSSGQRTKFGPGEHRWRVMLQVATTEQRQQVSEKLARWSERRAS